MTSIRTRHPSTTVLLYSLLSLLPITLAQTCRWKNGQDATDYFACDPTAAQSSCCLQGEACVGNGLCYGSLGQIYRGACAGGWGNETACPEQCNDAGSDGGWANLFMCPGLDTPSGATAWWCGDTSVVTPCDTEGTSNDPTKAQAFSLPWDGMLPAAIMPWSAQNFTGCAVSNLNEYSLTRQIENATQAAESGDGNSTTCSCPNSSNNSTTSPSNSNPKADCPNGAQIGEGVVIGVLALLSLGLAGWALWERRQRKRLMASGGAIPDQGANQYLQQYHNYKQHAGGQEMAPSYTPAKQHQTPVAEIGSLHRDSRHELHG